MNILPFLLIIAQIPGGPPAQDSVLAKIGATEIKAQDVAPFLWEWYGHAALQEYLAFKLISEEGNKQGIKLDDKAIQDAVNQQVEQFKAGLQQGQDLEEEMRIRGITRARLRQRVVADMILNRLAEAEFKPEGYVKGSTIVIQPKDESAVALQEALTKANQAYERLKKGDKWEDVLKASTNDPSLLQNNGQLDWVAVTAFPSEVQAELRTLSVGAITKPVKTPYGIQIFRLDKTGKTASADELSALKARVVAQQRPLVFQRLYQQVKIEPPK